MTSFQFRPPLTGTQLSMVVATLVIAGIVLRVVGGRAAEPARRWGLLGLRGALLIALFALLSGPVHVEESRGRIQRPDLFLMVDASKSMDIGEDRTRFQDAVGVIENTLSGVSDESMADGIRLFRFGHRLQSVQRDENAPSDATNDSQTNLRDAIGLNRLSAEEPNDSDSRLAEAFRQLSGRFGRQPPAGVVLLSDGRVRDTEAVEQLARHFAAQNVPIHAYPLGNTERGGDIAIVSAVIPQYVRKYSDVELQVFLRSFGFTGRRTEVQIVAPGSDGAVDETLATLPITLSGGAQSVTLSIRSDNRGRDIEIRIPNQEDEISTRNNVMAAHIRINRTKIRVLYIEGSDQPIRATQSATATSYSGAFTFFEHAVLEDEDVECVTLVEYPGSRRLMRLRVPNSSGAQRGFPESVAELAAFDCVILSDVSSSIFSDEQLQWLAQWIENRGGGLCMVGGQDSYSGGGWDSSPLGPMLPVNFASETWTPSVSATVTPHPDMEAHSLWHIVSDQRQNQEIVQSLPAFAAIHRDLQPKPLSTILGECLTLGEEPVPAVVAGQYGRGRTLAIAFPMTEPHAQSFQTAWGPAGNRNAAKLLRNLVYWVSEGSFIGRRRLVADVDKQFYRPGETINLSATAYDETADRTTGYEIWGMIEPQVFDVNDESLYTPVLWPNGVPREGGDDSLYVAWGEEFPVARVGDDQGYAMSLELAEMLRSGASDEGLRIELTAYENTGQSFGFARGTQVDSTSMDIQILDDPFEQQNPFPNHDLMRRVASVSGGRVLASPSELTELVTQRPVEQGPPVSHATPLWSRWWLLALLIGLLTIEWIWRRKIGMA